MSDPCESSLVAVGLQEMGIIPGQGKMVGFEGRNFLPHSIPAPFEEVQETIRFGGINIFESIPGVVRLASIAPVAPFMNGAGKTGKAKNKQRGSLGKLHAQ
jgi:hypothetical protein